nr:tripartite motif-containing protein 5-like [Cherax quadricarinatus]
MWIWWKWVEMDLAVMDDEESEGGGEWLCCGVCDEPYSSRRTPRNLECGHTFCSACMTQVLARDRRCPECRASITAISVTSLPISYAILRLSSSATVHTRRRSNSLPEIIPGSEQNAGVCRAHGDLLYFRCQSCCMWACIECVVLEHRGTNLGFCRVVRAFQAVLEVNMENEKFRRSLMKKLASVEKKLSAEKSCLAREWGRHLERITRLRSQLHEEKKVVVDIQRKNEEMNKIQKDLEAWSATVRDLYTEIQPGGSLREATVALQNTADGLKSVELSIELAELHMQPLLAASRVPKMPDINPR